VGPHDQCGLIRKISFTPGFDPRTVQPIATERPSHSDANRYNKAKIKYTFKISEPNLTGMLVILFLGKVDFVIRHNFSSDHCAFWNLSIHTFIREIRQLAARFNATQTDDHCFT